MQDVEIYIGETTALSGTITYQAGNNLTDSTKSFFINPEIVGNTIVNNTNGKRSTVVGIYGDQTIILDVPVTDFGSNTDSYTILQNQELADTFKDETISLTQSIKNTKDIAKVQTDFTQSFTLPASKTNNKIFKHYYRTDVLEGFDSRFLISSTIKMNGVNFKTGKIRLLGVKMKDNNPYAYKVSFVGNTVSLKTTFGDDELTDLPYLDAYNHIYSYSNIELYMQNGYNPTGDGAGTVSYPELMYPFISTSKNRYYYDTSETTNSQPQIPNVRNIFNNGTPSSDNNQDYRAIQYFDLKPAIKIYNILKAIEERYGFTISDDFLRTSVTSSGKPNVDGLFAKLYMFCNRKAGSLLKVIETDSAEVKLQDLTLGSGTEVRNSASRRANNVPTDNSAIVSTLFSRSRSHVNYEANITLVGGGSYDVELYDVDTEEVYYSQKNNVSSTFNLVYEFKTTTFGRVIYKPSLRVSTKGGVASFTTTSVTLVRTIAQPGVTTIVETGNYSKASIALSNGIDFRNKLLPKIKVIDFMTNLFKMFNLIAYFEGNELVVKTLDQYYLNSSHEEFNIDEYVDISSTEVNRSDIYNEINYEYKKANTIFAINSNEATNDEYGNERFNSEGNKIFDGKKYDVKVGFGHMIYENLLNNGSSSVSGTITDAASNYIEDLGQTFTENRWVINSVIVNNTTGEEAVVVKILDDENLELNKSGEFSSGNTYTIQATGAFSGITFGHTVSQDNAPVIDGGSLFLMDRISLTSNIWLTNKLVGVDASTPEQLTKLYVPANVYTGDSVGVRSINFGSEFDEFTNEVEEDSLFKTYHQNFILNIYNPQTRILKITAHLPLKVLLKYELNDRFVVGGKKYLINSIKTNLQTGKSDLELLTDNYGE